MKDDVSSLIERNPQMTPWPALAPFARVWNHSRGKDRLFLYDTGDAGFGALPIVLIHGLGDEADSWRSLFPLLQNKRRVVAVDLPGFGRSPCRARASFARHVAVVADLLEEVGRSVLVGSSMGAAIVEHIAFTVPEKVAGLVLLDGGLPSGGALSPAMLRMLMPVLGERAYRAFRRDHEAAYRSLEPYYADLNALSDNEKAFLRSRVVARVESDTQLHAYFESLRSLVANAAFRGASYGPKLAAYPGPVLIGWGELDRIMPLDTARPLREARADAEFVVFPGAGHLPHQEAPAAVADAIAAFIAPTCSR